MTDIIKKIGSAGVGRDYSSTAAFLADRTIGMVAANENWIAEYYNDSEFVTASNTFIEIIGCTTDATHRTILRIASGQGRTGGIGEYDVSGGVGIRSTDSYGTVLKVHESYARVEGLQFKSAASSFVMDIQGVGIEVVDCIFHSGATIATTGSTTACKLINTFINSSFGHGSTALAEFYNCYVGGTISAPYSPGVLAKNTYAGNWTGTFDAGCTNNASANTTAPGANPVINVVPSAAFTNSSTDFTLKTGSVLIGAGVRDATHTNDLDAFKVARATSGPTDIGPFAVPGGGGGGGSFKSAFVRGTNQLVGA